MARRSRSTGPTRAVNLGAIASVGVVLAAACSGAEPRPEPDRSQEPEFVSACCQVYRDCKPAQEPISRCASDAPVVPLAELLRDAARWHGTKVRVRGHLDVFPRCTLVSCRRGDCCNECGGWLALGDERTGMLFLDRFECHGDDSTMCCPVDGAYRDVVAEGRFEKAPDGHSNFVRYALKGDAGGAPALCVPSDASPAPPQAGRMPGSYWRTRGPDWGKGGARPP